MNKAMKEGTAAYKRGDKLGDNPYARYTKMWDWWREGWTSAKIQK